MRSFWIPAALAAAALLLVTGCQTHIGAPVRGASAPAQATSQRERPQVLIKFKQTMRAQQLSTFRAQFGTRNVSMISGIDVYVEEIVSDVPLKDVLAALNAAPEVEYAEANSKVSLDP